MNITKQREGSALIVALEGRLTRAPLRSWKRN